MISIIIPTYKRVEALKRLVDSILPQLGEDMEMVIVDDCSQDATEAYLRKQAAQHANIRVHVNEKNQGVNYSRNRGIELASKKFILFIDSDDELKAGSLIQVKETLLLHAGRTHFLFLVSDREKEFYDMKQVKDIYYEDWLSGRVYGDFTHVILSSIMKRYPFHQEFRMFEHLNWLRIKKETSPQLLVPVITTERERGRSDSLTVQGRFSTVGNIQARFNSEKIYYSLYHEDLRQHNPHALTNKLVEAVLLGVASGQKSDSRALIGYARSGYIKVLGTMITLLPSSLVRNIIIGYSNYKSKRATGIA